MQLYLAFNKNIMDTQQAEIFREEVRKGLDMDVFHYQIKEEIWDVVKALLDYWMCAIDTISWAVLEKIDTIFY